VLPRGARRNAPHRVTRRDPGLSGTRRVTLWGAFRRAPRGRTSATVGDPSRTVDAQLARVRGTPAPVDLVLRPGAVDGPALGLRGGVPQPRMVEDHLEGRHVLTA